MVNSFEDIPARDRVIVALDCGIDEAFDLADRLQGKVAVSASKKIHKSRLSFRKPSVYSATF